jgi:ribonucleoside-triphosphate reductase
MPTPYQEFIHLSRYARWRDDLGRREMWPETVQRWENFWTQRLVDKFAFSTNEAVDFVSPLSESILALDVMPSMRSLMTAGPALERDNVAGFNCAYVEIDDLMAFAEVMYNLMCGTGVGFSVERQCVKRLPEIPESLHDTPPSSRWKIPSSAGARPSGNSSRSCTSVRFRNGTCPACAPRARAS